MRGRGGGSATPPPTKRRMVYYEEYKTCSCSFVAAKREDLPGYCPRHFTNRRRRIRIPDMGFEMGLAG